MALSETPVNLQEAVKRAKNKVTPPAAADPTEAVPDILAASAKPTTSAESVEAAATAAESTEPAQKKLRRR